jgi:hypothetical protein
MRQLAVSDFQQHVFAVCMGRGTATNVQAVQHAHATSQLCLLCVPKRWQEWKALPLDVPQVFGYMRLVRAPHVVWGRLVFCPHSSSVG